MKHIVDSSGWLEYFANTINAKNFASLIEQPEKLIIPSIVIFEVFKKALQESNENTALRIVAHMKLGQVVDLNMELSLSAAKQSHLLKIPMADSIILTTTQKYNATLWTQDSDFIGFPRVKYFEKK